MQMKKSSVLFFSACCLSFSCLAQKTIEVSNPTDLPREEVISIPYNKFSKHFGVDSSFTIQLASSQTALTYQLEKQGKSSIQNVLILVPIDGNGRVTLSVSKSESPASFQSKAYARYVPERLDDFAWENDVLAFRMYGKALEGHRDDAQGMDVWAKRTENLIINKWYKENDYHTDHGEGLDYYSVGQTLGVGDLALFFDDSIHFTKHYRQHEVLDNGPLRTTFKLTYEEASFNGQEVSLTKTISLDAKKHFNKIIVAVENKQAGKTPVALGLVKRGEASPQFDFDVKNQSLAYWEPDVQSHGHTATALIVPKENINFIASDKQQFLISSTIKNRKPFVYYNGAAWDRAGKVTTAAQWETLVDEEVESIKKPLIVRLK